MTQQPFTPLVPRPDGRSYTIPAPVPVPELLARIQAHPLDKEGAEFQFSERLAQDNGWPAGFAQRVIDEYRRFVYLACVADEEVTPSDEVDQAWHLHLAYTRDYWEEFCPNVLGRPLHHGPTDGGDAERERYETNYRRTLEMYERTFRERPPSDIWPPASIRFEYAPGNVRVNTRLFAIVPKRKPKRSWIQRLGVFTFAAVLITLVLLIWPYPRLDRGTADLIFLAGFCITVTYLLLRAIAGVASNLRGILRKNGQDEVITQPQHGYTVAFTVGVVVAAGVAEATVTGVEVTPEGSGQSGEGGGGGGCGSGCGGGGCGGGGCGGS